MVESWTPAAINVAGKVAKIEYVSPSTRAPNEVTAPPLPTALFVGEDDLKKGERMQKWSTQINLPLLTQTLAHTSRCTNFSYHSPKNVSRDYL